MKRLLDLFISMLGLLLSAPVTLPTMFLVWLQDWHSPFYVAPRVGKGGRVFKMIKMRSMVINADKSGVDSTGAQDKRITALGHFIRRYKLDELTQLWNVFIGDMSLVGPRPNVKRETDLYTSVEQKLLSVKPGITDFASIVFADEGDILKDKSDPDIAYHQLIRPWKSRLALLNLENSSLWVDLRVIELTAMAIVSRRRALIGVQKLVSRLGAAPELITIAGRERPLVPTPPPGAVEVVTSRNVALQL
jgi:lipopolysaccharide/colanic/teichoic acid biosynthesis glycosyltransferase